MTSSSQTGSLEKAVQDSVVASREDARPQPEGGVAANLRSEFSARLGTALEGLEMSQRELSQRSGIQAAAISRFVSGHKAPGLNNLIRLIRAMPGVNANWLLGLATEQVTSEYEEGYFDAVADSQAALQEVSERATNRFSEGGK
jgi:transcriptional regulator with XRE-family HTH domain